MQYILLSKMWSILKSVIAFVILVICMCMHVSESTVTKGVLPLYSDTFDKVGNAVTCKPYRGEFCVTGVDCCCFWLLYCAMAWFYPVILKDDGATGQDDGTIIRSKCTVAHCPGHGPSPDDDGTVWAVVDDGQSCCLRNKRTLLPPRHLFIYLWIIGVHLLLVLVFGVLFSIINCLFKTMCLHVTYKPKFYCSLSLCMSRPFNSFN